MDTFVDSSWYWLRYLDPHNPSTICDPKKSTAALPVDTYVGGVEHSILHLLYARFVGKFLLRSGLVRGAAFEAMRGEPFKQLVAQGMVQGRTFRCPDTKRYLRPEELDFSKEASPIVKTSGKPAEVSFEKMSKSKFNGVEPSKVLATHGVDATRLYMLYKAAPADELTWDETGIVGMERWLQRCWRLVQGVAPPDLDSDESPRVSDEKTLKSLLISVNTTIEEVTRSLSTTRGFHVAIAALMQLTTALERPEVARQLSRADRRDCLVAVLVRLAAPMAPCAASELWQRLWADGAQPVPDLFAPGSWPTVTPVEAASRDVLTCVVMVRTYCRQYL
ncbi:Leucyl-tRNA synthetase, mitochondrial [Cladochytrium tenue]|nr:Leucyl-tRNA synthetase, mitochondrial [Cladochytrium tenue]